MIKAIKNREVMLLAKQYGISDQLNIAYTKSLGVVDELDGVMRGFVFYNAKGKGLYCTFIGASSLQGFNNIVTHLISETKLRKKETLEIPLVLHKHNIPYLERLKQLGFCSSMGPQELILNSLHLERYGVT